MEDLIEIADAEEQLTGQLTAQYRVQNHGVVLHVDGRDFKVVTQVGTRRGQRQAGARRLSLASLSREPVERKMLVGVEVMIHLDHAIVAIARARNGREVIAPRRRKACNGTGPQSG